MRRLTVRLKKAGKAGLVPVQKQVTKKGKTFTQTFYVKPDSVPAPPKMLDIAEAMAEKREETVAAREEWKGPLGDERAYVVTSSSEMDAKAIRIPEDTIAERFMWHGMSFVLHRPWDSDNGQFSTNGWIVTETVSGLRISSNPTISGVKEAALVALEDRGPEKIARLVEMSPTKVASLPSDRFEEAPKIEAPPVPATENEFEALTGHIMENILNWDVSESLSPARGDVLDWVRTHYTTSGSIDDALTDLTADDDIAVALAVKYSLDYDDAKEIQRDLIEVVDYGNYGTDEVLDWYVGVYNGEELPSTVNLGTYSDYGNEWDTTQVIDFAIENDVSLEAAQEAADDATQADDEEYEKENLHPEVTDSNGNHWDSDEVNLMVRWIGGEVSWPRNDGKRVDRERREGGTGESNDYVADLFLNHSVPLDDKVLYRGTAKAAWAKVQPGDVYEHSFSSFTKDRDFARRFTMAASNEEGYDRFVIVLTPPEGESLRGIDIADIGDTLEEEDIQHPTFAQYNHEREVVVRAPSLKVTKVDEETIGVNRIRYIHVIPNEMELVDVMKSRFNDLSEEIWESFNEPLSPRPETEEDDEETPLPSEG